MNNLDDLNDLNYYESELYKILLYKNKYKDKFYITIENDKIYIQRKDDSIGWGQNLELIVRDKIKNTDEIITVGSSEENIKTIDFITHKNITDKNYYENDIYKIFSISKKFNDVFKIIYDEDTKIINIIRLDDNIGWGQNLKLKYVNKINNREKIINIGKSLKNNLKINIDVEKLNYTNIYNYYESDNYIINVLENIYNDKFIIHFFEDNNTIYIKRIDSKNGWGQCLKLKIFNIISNHSFIIYIGPSKINELYKKIDLTIRKCFISLTTIPSRIKLPQFIQNINNILSNQTYEIENLFIVIAEKYKRFQENIPENIIKELSSLDKVIIIKIENDFGPSSKYLAPLIHYYDMIKNNILVIIDDDRIYNPNLLSHFVIAYNSYPNITFSSGLWNYYFNKNYKNMDSHFLEIELYKESNTNNFFFGQGLGGFFGFAIKVENMEDFIQYNLKILNRIPKSFYHDEGIMLGYLKYKEEYILYLKHYGCNYIEKEMIDALCNSNLVNRGEIEKEILQITNLEKII
jgi:hypothetical protein